MSKLLYVFGIAKFLCRRGGYERPLFAAVSSEKNFCICRDEVKFTGFEPGTERSVFYKEFNKYGPVSKLFIHASNKFGVVKFENPDDARKALRTGSNNPPLFLKMQPNERNSENASISSGENMNIHSKRHNKLYTGDDFEAEYGECKLDIHGNMIPTVVDDYGTVYVPLQSVRDVGFELFDPDQYSGKLHPKEQLLKEFQLYMMAKAKKFMIRHNVHIKDSNTEDAIKKCKEQTFEKWNDGCGGKLQQHQQQQRRMQSNYSDERPLRKPKSEHNHHNPGADNSPRKKFDVKIAPLMLDLSKNHEVLISHVVDDKTCYVRLVSESDTFEKLRGQCNSISNTGTAVTAPFGMGKIYLAQLNSEWGRAQAMNNEIFFIDYGITAVRRVVKTIPASLLATPRQAVKIVFKPNDKVYLEEGQKILVKPVMKMENFYLVESINKNRKEEIKQAATSSIPDQFEPINNNSKLSEYVCKFVNNDDDDSQTPKKKEVKSAAPADDLVERKEETVKATDKPSALRSIMDKVGSTGIICHTATIGKDHFVAYAYGFDFQDDIEFLELITDESKPDPSYKPSVGNFVAVENKDDGTWVRGVVVDIINDKYKCALIDYGVYTEKEEVRPLPKKFHDVPYLCCFCKSDPETIEQVKAAGEKVAYRVLENNKLELTIDKKTFVVEAEVWDPLKKSPVKKKVYCKIPEIFNLKDGDVVMITDVGHPRRLFVQTKNCAQSLKEVTNELQDLKVEKLQSPPKPGQLVLSPCPDLEGLYRGVVKAIYDEKVEIEYIDYGNVETILIKDLFNVNEKLAAIPCAVINTPKVKGSNETGFSTRQMAFIIDNLQRKCVAVLNDKADEIDFKFSDGLMSETFARFNREENEKKINEEIKKSEEREFEEQARREDAEERRIHEAEEKRREEIALKERDDAEIKQRKEAETKAMKETLQLAMDKQQLETETPKSPVKEKKSRTSLLLKNLKPGDKAITLCELPDEDIRPGEYQCLCVSSADLRDGMVTFLKADTDTTNTLGKIGEEIEAYVAGGNTQNYTPKLLDVCLAKFEDGWFRGAVVEDLNADGKYTVFFIDYGNTETVAASEIIKLPAHLGAIPALAKICTLDGLLKHGKDEVSDALYERLKKLFREEETYAVEVVSTNKMSNLIVRVPTVYEILAAEGLLP